MWLKNVVLKCVGEIGIRQLVFLDFQRKLCPFLLRRIFSYDHCLLIIHAY